MSYLEDTPEYSNFYAVYLNLVNTTSFSSFQVLCAPFSQPQEMSLFLE